ncbi:hypothetical protein I4U23_007754 [Adineta vaga]|nr:hypothetical protein I4U23_007754 [Adineta vaga]
MALTNRTDSALFISVSSSTSLLSSYYTNSTNSGQLSTYDGETATASSKRLNFFENLTIQITLIVSVIGLIGNTCTIIVLNRQSMRKWRSSMLLSALAGVDLLFLLIIFLSILDTLTDQAIGLHRSMLFCQATVYITHVCSFLSANFTLSFTLQRFVAVLFPLHANTIISSRSSTINILVLTLFACGFYSFSFFLTNIARGECREDETHAALYPLLIFDTCFTFVLPFIFILLFNCAIVYKLRNRKRFSNIFGGSLTTAPGSRNQRTSSPLLQVEIIFASSIDRSCTFLTLKYEYISKATFQYIPTTIIDHTVLNIVADVIYYQSKSPCNQSFIELHNLTVHPYENASIQTDTKQLEHAILQIFHRTFNVLQNTTDEVIFLEDYSNLTKEYRRIKTIQTNHGRFMGNSIFANYLLNKLFSPTTTTCETIINRNENKLETSNCLSKTASLLTIERQIHFHSHIDHQTLSLKEKKTFSIQLKTKTKTYFDQLLKDLCTDQEMDSYSQLITIMNNELDDNDFYQILLGNVDQYSNCERNLINQNIINTIRYPSTEYILKHFHHDQTIIANHLDMIERQLTDSTKESLRKYLKNISHQRLNYLTLRILTLISNDNLTIQYALNRNNSIKDRIVSFRILNQPIQFHNHFHNLLNDEQESSDLRIIAFQMIHLSLNSFEMKNLIEKVQSNQLRFYIKSLFKQSSLWSSQSGSYLFPFGKIHVIFHENLSSIFPNIIQFELANQTEIDLYLDDEILLVFGRKSMIRFSNIDDLFNWLNNDRLYEIETLDGFRLKINLITDFNLNWFLGYFDQLKNFFRKSNAGFVLKIQHELDHIMTGYEIRFNLESNFKIHRYQDENSTSFIWRAIQKENILFKIEQSIIPLKTAPLPSMKDFCYIIPHFNSKICLSIIFNRLWPSSIAIRLLSDDPSLVYNLTSSFHYIHFHIQQHQQIYRSYRLQRKFHKHPSMPYYLELSTPTTNYSSVIEWNDLNIISFTTFYNNQSVAYGSGDYRYNSTKNLSINITNVHPKHIGNVFIFYNGNLSINASKFLGGRFILKLDSLSDWRHAQIQLKLERVFFFFKQDILLNLHYNFYQSSFNLSVVRNDNGKLQWMFIKRKAYLHHLFILHTSLLEFNHNTQIHYNNLSNINFQSSSLMNGWSLWNISFHSRHFKQIHFHFNRYSFDSYIKYRTFELKIFYSNQKLLQTFLHLNQSNFITLIFEIPGYHYEGKGQLSTDYTNFSINLPIIERTKKNSNLQIEFLSFPNHLLFNLTSHFRHEYSFHSIHNLTFQSNYLFQTFIQQSLKMSDYSLFSFHSFSQYMENSTILQHWNGSLHLPSIFVTKPFLFSYEKDSQFFMQIFEWTNLTRTSLNYHISTISGLQLIIINDFPTRIHIHFEQNILGKPYLLLFELDRNWMMSLIINKSIRYELISSPSNSSFSFKRIHLKTNQTQILPMNYYTDNQTLIRIEIAFSKFVSKFLNDFILDISLKNHTGKILCHIPLFKREFFSFIWNRYVQKEFFHFSGSFQLNVLRRRRWFDYHYNWNLASFRFWTLDSRLILFSFDPIQWNLNITNDYLWWGKWTIDYRMMLGNRRELIRLHHEYQYTTIQSNLIFDLYLINSHYDLNLTYNHSTHFIQGLFLKNQDKHEINGYWNTTGNLLHLNTLQMKSMTIITPTFIKSIIERHQEKIGFLFQRTTEQFKNDSEIIQCNPYLTLQIRPRLFVAQYYTLNDDLSTMMFEWSTGSYLSWNYTGHGRMLIPLNKFEIDLRTNYIFHIHTTTFKYSSIYNNSKRQLIIRRLPQTEDADDRYEFKLRYYHNRTILFHLQVINNHYRMIVNPNFNETYWNLSGYFRNDPFNGSLLFPNNDWYFSSKLNFNSSFYISTGRYVQFISTVNPQLAVEILSEPRFHFVFQYAGLLSLIAFKFFHNSSNLNLFFSSKSINQTTFHVSFQLNQFINQSWILLLDNHRFYLYNHNHEFILNGSLQDFTFQHQLDDKNNVFSINENTIQYLTHQFGIIVSNLSSDTTHYLHLYNLQTKENFTINYYKSGRFFKENQNIQTPIYDINMIYYPNTDENRYVKIILEFLPLQMSSFNLVRGRSFRVGYQTFHKQLILSGNLAFTIEDIDHQEKIIMNERWKLIYGYEKSERLFIKWNINIDTKEKTLQGKMNIHDPNEKTPKPILLQLKIDQRILTHQFISIKLVHEVSQTNLSFTLDHYSRRKLLIRLKSNSYLHDKTLLHLYANTSESQLHLLLILANQINLNLTLPKSYPETGLLHSAIFIDNEEYFDGRLDPTTLRLRSKEYLFNLTTNQLVIQKRFHQQILASILARWIDRNSSVASITIFSRTDYQRKSFSMSQITQQKTWFKRVKQFLFENQLALEFFQDCQKFFLSMKTDFIDEQGQFGKQFIDHLDLDNDFKLLLQKIDKTTKVFLEIFSQIGFGTEQILQEYMNNLTCFTNHRNLLHFDMAQLTTLFIDTFVYEIVHHVNKTLTMFNHFTHYPRSMSAILSYLSNEVILEIYKFIKDFYLETKQFFLAKIIRYLYDMDFLMKIVPVLSDSITFFSSSDFQTGVRFINDRIRQLLSLWLESPFEYKIMKTFTRQLIEWIDKIRFYIDDKFDFLLPTLQIASLRLSMNGTNNQTFLLTWLKQYNLTNLIDKQ